MPRGLWLLSTTLVTLVSAASAVQAADVTIDGGQSQTVPGDHADPWSPGDEIAIGDAGDGELTVDSGATVDVVRHTLLGNSAGSSGTLTVTGTGTLWATQTGNHIVGNVGRGQFTVSDGATATTDFGIIAEDPSSIGDVRIQGSGSKWRTQKALIIGRDGVGTLTVENGATTEVGSSILIGDDNPTAGRGDGTLVIRGADSSVVTTGYTSVGNRNNGIGTLTIQQGGELDTSEGIIGWKSGNEGEVRVTGSGSVWDSSSYIYLGYAGEGAVTLDDGGVMRAGGGNGNLYVANGSTSSGTLNIGAPAGHAARVPGTLVADKLMFGAGDGTLVFNHGASGYSFSADIAGNGKIRHLNGTTHLTGDASSFSGTTTVSGGMLVVDTTLGGDVQIQAPATLSGSGTVGSLALSGTLAPGNSIGTLSVDGDITFDAGSTYTVETDAAGNSDRVDATGTATINGGSVDVIAAAAGDYARETDYTIVSADGGVTGSFDDVTSNLAFLDPSLGYGANTVTLTLTRNDVDFGSVANTPNQKAVSGALTMADEKGKLPGLVDRVAGESAAGARATYDNLSGVQHTHNRTMLLRQQIRFRGLLFERLGGDTATATGNRDSVRLAFAGEDWARTLAGSSAATAATGEALARDRGFWVRATGGTGDIDATTNASGSDYTSATLALGSDTRLANGVTVGLAGGYGRTDADTAGGGLDIDSYQLAGYAGWSEGGLYVDTMLGYARHRTDANRGVTTGGGARTARADYEADQVAWSIEGGHRWAWSETTRLTPFLGLDFSQTEREGFTERGAGAANLDVAEETTDSLRTRVGLRIAGTLEAAGTRLAPWAEVAWVREHGDRDATMTAHFDPAPATTFEVAGPKLDRDRAAIGLGVTAGLSETSHLDLEYRGEIAGSDDHHGIAVTWRERW